MTVERQELLKNFIPDDKDSEEKDILSYVKRLLRIELELKALRKDRSDIKKEAKANKIPVSEADIAVRALIAEMKKSDNQISEIDSLKILMEKDLDTKLLMSQVVNGE